ncbi:hypothetical protein [Lutibacter sp.]|uniref:hypothetical protein n=1 Tax=Lutibacter sp. TaxID=1925666 RepID=UPI0034A03632
MNKEDAILESIKDLVDFLEQKEMKKFGWTSDKTFLLRKIKDRIYTILNPSRDGNCCEMPSKDEIHPIARKIIREEEAKEKFLTRERA